MINIESDFWSEKHPVNIDLTYEMVEACEKTLGFKLPQKLIDLLMIQNGGYTKNICVGSETKIEEAFGIYFNEENPTILDSEYLIKEWGLPENQLLISGDGHTWITLDYSKHPSLPVKFIDVDDNKTTIISNSFEEFLEIVNIEN